MLHLAVIRKFDIRNLEFRKAFDSVSHKDLLMKVWSIGIQTLEMIQGLPTLPSAIRHHQQQVICPATSNLWCPSREYRWFAAFRHLYQ